MKTEKTAAQELREAWEWCVRNRDAGVFHRQRLNYESRYCIWENQSLDGKKWKAKKGKEIFPWEGASDARVPLVDLYIQEDAAMLVTAARRMGTQVAGVESGDEGFGKRLQGLLRWQKCTQMPEYWGELRLLASYGLERGAAILMLFWNKERQMVYQDVDLESVAQMAMNADPEVQQQVMQLVQLIQNPASEAEAAGLLTQAMGEAFAEAGMGKVRKLVRNLRTAGHGKIALPQTVKDGPRVKALLLNEEVFLPPEATGIGDEVYVRELITETTLRERVGTLGWDEAWVEAMLEKQKGVISTDLGLAASAMRTQNGVGSGVLTTSRLFEVIHAYRRVCNEDGVPELRYTCFNPGLLREADNRGGRRPARSGTGLEGLVAYDGPLGYDGGELPFVLWEPDKHARLVDEARGYGERASTLQAQIKTEWDSRVDRASLATLPPLLHAHGAEPDRWGPGVRMPVRRRDEVGFAEAPKYDIGSKEVEATVRAFADQLFGRPREGQVTAEGTALKQALVDSFLEAVGKGDAQILKLDQQFMPDRISYRVMGSKTAKPVHMTREEIQGSFDVVVGYNVEMMDPNTKKERIELMQQALAMDVNGIVDRDASIAAAFEMIDPNLGERVLRPGEEASQKEIEDEQTVFAKMSAGIPVDIKPGQAYGLRLQTLQGILQNSPPAQQKYLSDENFRKLVDWRMQQLGQQLEQRQNAIVGRLGGQSGYDQFK